MRTIQNPIDVPVGEKGYVLLQTANGKVTSGSYINSEDEFKKVVAQAWSNGDPGNLILLKVERVVPTVQVSI